MSMRRLRLPSRVISMLKMVSDFRMLMRPSISAVSSGNGYVSAEAGTIKVTGDVNIEKNVGARTGGSIIVQGAVTSATGSIQVEEGGSVTAGSANVKKLYASAKILPLS